MNEKLKYAMDQAFKTKGPFKIYDKSVEYWYKRILTYEDKLDQWTKDFKK